MAKLTILSSFDQIARPLEGARTQNCDRSISYGIWCHISRPLFLIQKFVFFTPPYSAIGFNPNLLQLAALTSDQLTTDKTVNSFISGYFAIAINQ